MRPRADLKRIIEAQLAGEILPSPAERALGIQLTAAGGGKAVFSLDVDDRHLSHTGAVHGGVLAALADGAMATALVSALGHNETCLSLEVRVSYIRAVTGGTLLAEGSVVARTRTTGIAECRVTDRDGNLVAHATSTLMIQRRTRDATTI